MRPSVAGRFPLPSAGKLLVVQAVGRFSAGTDFDSMAFVRRFRRARRSETPREMATPPHEFDYQAVTADGKATSGRLSGATDREVVLKLQKLGLVPLSVAPAGTIAPAATARAKGRQVKPAPATGKHVTPSSSLARRLFGLQLTRRRIRTKDLIDFAENLAILLESGVPLNKALGILNEVAPNKQIKAVVQDIHTRVREGSSLGEAIEAQGAFPPVFSGLVQAGERGGILESVLKRLAEYLKGVQEIKEYLVSAMIYPVILTFTSAVSMIILLTFVIPKFATIFADIGVALPLMTKIMLVAGNFMQAWWWAVLIGLAAAVLGLRAAIRTPRGRRIFDGMKLKAPLLGPIFVKIEVARMASTLGTLLANGVAILTALNMVRGAVQNSIIREDLGEVYTDLKEGRLLSASLAKRPYFPAQAVQLIGVGEETGRLDTLLSKVAEIYEKDLRVAIKSFTAMIEPVIILVMGLVIGLMVVSMLLAIFSINQVEL